MENQVVETEEDRQHSEYPRNDLRKAEKELLEKQQKLLGSGKKAAPRAAAMAEGKFLSLWEQELSAGNQNQGNIYFIIF